MSIAENIKRLRIQHGLSQLELANIIGVSDKAVSTWELGTKTPRMGAIQRMADYFGVLKSDIIEDDKIDLTDYARLEALHQNPRLGLLFDRQVKMSDSDIEMMLALAGRILKERDGDD